MVEDDVVSSVAPAPGEDRSVALALVNTRLERRGSPLDLIAEPRQALSWLAERGLLKGKGGTREQSRVVAEQVWTLRGTVRALLLAFLEEQPAPMDALEHLNRVLVAAPRVAVLAWTARGAPQREEHGSGGDELDQALGTIAADALELLSGPERVALARCPASGCSRLLLRTHGKRQWCSTRCGDRVRAARHYARTRAAGGRGHP